MSKRITIEELQSYLWNSAVLLRTNIDAGAYKQYIFPLLFFKRICDVYDEETAKAVEEYGDDASEFDEDEIHTFIVPKGYHWNDVRAVSENVGVAIVEAFRKVENANSDKLQGIFGDGAWTNKNRLPDRLLKDLLEHFSTKTLSIANCPEDELGQGYEYLIKKFADDSGHTAQEFYTNRTVVHLMTEMLKPESGESIYDPTCGSAGMLISAIAYLKEQGKEWRNVAVYGQEINALTSAIGKMNLFLHGVKDFSIVNGDTLASPAFIENGKLQQFDLCLANPPYSISQWDRAAFESDKYGRNFLGVPPQGRADYAFLQHIIASLKEDTGRCAILFPHGVLFRNEESAMRERLVRSDRVECVIGLGPNLFYNSPMEACIMICRMTKRPERRGQILFINAVNEVERKNAQSYLEDRHIQRIATAYKNYCDDGDFAIATWVNIRVEYWLKEIQENIVRLEGEGSSHSAALATTMLDSFFVNNVDLYFKLTGSTIDPDAYSNLCDRMKDIKSERTRSVEISNQIKALEETNHHLSDQLEAAQHSLDAVKVECEERVQQIEQDKNKLASLLAEAQTKIDELQAAPSVFTGNEADQLAQFDDTDINTAIYELAEAGVAEQYRSGLAAFLCAAYIEKQPLLLVGPNAIDIAQAFSATVAAHKHGEPSRQEGAGSLLSQRI